MMRTGMTRSRPAFGLLARPSLAAAGVAAPIATIAVLLGSRAWIVVAVAAWAALAAFVVAAPRLWPEAGEGAAARITVAIAWAASMIAFVVGVFGHYAIAVDHQLCGGRAGATAVAAAGAATVYLVGSVWALHGRTRALWAWPLLMLAAWGAHLLLLFVLPGAHGFCET
jgi:hypothetical protein